MKKSPYICAIAITVIVVCSSFAPADNRKNESSKGRGYKEHHDDSDRRNHMEDRDNHSRDDHKKRRDYSNHHGYRDRPYDRHRHYDYYHHNGIQYEYHGHWASWAQWDAYSRNHPDIRAYGRYYRDGAHLMLRFCDPGTSNCVFFSIGR